MALLRYSMGDRVSRAAGGSAVASAAYQARESYWDQREAKTHNYRPSPIQEASEHDAGRKYGDRVAALFVGLYAPDHAPDWMRGRENIERFWNAAEAAERRKDAQVAERVIIALPKELTLEQNKWLLQDHVREFTRQGRVVQVSIHAPEHGQENVHCHLLISTRGVNENGFNATKTQEQQARFCGRRDYVEGLRENWAKLVNHHLERHGFAGSLDHRSYKRRGLDREPGVHLGPALAQKERDGIKTAIGDINRAIGARNAARQQHPQQDANLHLEDKQWLDHVPSGLRRLDVRDVAKELSPAYKQATAAADAAHGKAEHAKRSFEHWEQAAAVAAYRIAERRAAMGVVAKILNVVVRPDPEVANWQREKRKSEIMRDRAGVHFGAARDAGAAAQRRAEIEFEKIRPEAEAELAKRQQIAGEARANLHRLDHQQRQSQTRRLKYDLRLRP